MDCITTTKRPAQLLPQEEDLKITPHYKKPYLDNRTVKVDITPNNVFLAGSNTFFKKIETLQAVSEINIANSGSLTRFQNVETINNLKCLRDDVESAIIRIYKSDYLFNNPPVILPPDSPISLESSASSPTTTEPDPLPPQGFKTATEGVVDGTGVMATRNFKRDEEICLYDGPMAYRILNHLSGKYYVFTITDNGDDGFNNIDFLEKDTYVAWSGVNVERAGTPAIEAGRNCEQDIRFLNHSKDANVMILYRGQNTVKWGDQESVRLTVIALRDINPGEELLLDYDSDKPDSEIKFDLTAVEEKNKTQQQKIIKRISRLNQKQIQSKLEPSIRVQKTELNLPDPLDIEIDNIIKTAEEIRIKNTCPSDSYQLLSRLTPVQKKLLKVIFLNRDSSVKDIAACFSTKRIRSAQIATMGQLTISDIENLKKYLTRSIFNGMQTWITVQELKEQLTLFVE